MSVTVTSVPDLATVMPNPSLPTKFKSSSKRSTLAVVLSSEEFTVRASGMVVKLTTPPPSVTRACFALPSRIGKVYSPENSTCLPNLIRCAEFLVSKVR